jgi:hypothetical protein
MKRTGAAAVPLNSTMRSMPATSNVAAVTSAPAGGMK